ncbi:MAG: hypothetical protein Q8S33_37985 [Myxococcales bacterium]|nr:hypothetical protein [Myxococcales bacterium]MDP3506192.1 hypothetical protein [Myxococcales bacterium]
MFVVNRSPAATPIREVTAPAASSPTATPAAPATPATSSNRFGVSTFEASATRNAPTPYTPTLAQLDRPTTATVLNITNGERQPLNPAQMSTEQGASFIQGRLQALGYSGPGQVANTSFPTTGPFRMDYGNDDRRHWDIDGINVGLAERLYANNPREVADAMLAADMQHARKTNWNEDDGQRFTQPAATPPMRLLPGTNIAAQLQQAPLPRGTPSPAPAPAAWSPTREELSRPTTATSLNIRTGERTPLNPAQMSNEQGVAFVRERLAALGFTGGTVSNQTAPTTGPFGIDYGTDDRRHWDVNGMNVGLTLQMYANNPREVADRMLADIARTQMRSPNDE